MNGVKQERFSSEVERLEWLLGEVKSRMEGLALHQATEEDHELFLTIMPLLRSAGVAAEGFQTLLREGPSEAALPLTRVIYEASDDIDIILREDDPDAQLYWARRLRIASLIELIEHLKVDYTTEQEEQVELVSKWIEKEKEQHPEIFAEVRKNRRPHWSGESRTSMAQDKGVGGLYRQLSWEAHLSMAALRDIEEADPDAGRVVFSRPGLEYAVQAHSFGVGGMIYHAWNNVATRFGLEKIVQPEQED